MVKIIAELATLAELIAPAKLAALAELVLAELSSLAELVLARLAELAALTKGSPLAGLPLLAKLLASELILSELAALLCAELAALLRAELAALLRAELAALLRAASAALLAAGLTLSVLSVRRGYGERCDTCAGQNHASQSHHLLLKCTWMGLPNRHRQSQQKMRPTLPFFHNRYKIAPL